MKKRMRNTKMILKQIITQASIRNLIKSKVIKRNRMKRRCLKGKLILVMRMKMLNMKR
jgi:hypothetical protein